MAGEHSAVSGLAGRYASALLELAESKHELDSVAADLRGLQQLIDDSEDLRRLLRSPVYNREQQAKALAAILDKAGGGDLMRRFVLTVAQNRRLFALSQMITAYLAELAHRRGEVIAEVTAAQPLNDAQQSRLTETLRRSVGAKVQIDLKVDPALIGGLIVRVGSRMIDSSLRTKLQKLQLAMKGVG